MVEPDAPVVAGGGGVVEGVRFGFAGVVADFVGLAVDHFGADLQLVEGGPLEVGVGVRAELFLEDEAQGDYYVFLSAEYAGEE